MKSEENRAVRNVAANGVRATAVYDHQDRLISVTIEDAQCEERFVIPGPLFAQVSVMIPGANRYGGGYVCADHGPQERPDYKWECPICHPPVPAVPKALPAVEPGPTDLTTVDIPF